MEFHDRKYIYSTFYVFKKNVYDYSIRMSRSCIVVQHVPHLICTMWMCTQHTPLDGNMQKKSTNKMLTTMPILNMGIIT